MPGTQTQIQVQFDNLLTSTWYRVRPGIVDQYHQIHPLYDKLMKGGRIMERASGGTAWHINVRYETQDQNIKYFSRGERFGRAEKEHTTRIIYEPKLLGTSITRYWDDDMKNAGERTKILDYVNEIVDTTKLALEDRLARDIIVQHSDPNSINALETLFPADPTTGEIAGKDRATNPWLRNKTIDFSAAYTSFDADITAALRNGLNEASKLRLGGKAMPDLIITTQTIAEALEELAEGDRMFDTTGAPVVDLAGAQAVKFKGIPIIWDPNMIDGQIMLINTSTLRFMYDPRAWFEMTEWKPEADNLERTAQIVCMGNLVCDCFARNCVIHSVTV